MKSIVIAVLTALSIAFAGVAGAGGFRVPGSGNGFPEGSIQVSAE